MAVQVACVESQPFAENSYVVWREGHAEACVIDPGFEPELILETLRDRDLTLSAIICTHGHVDHIAGNAELKRVFPAAPLIIGTGDAPLLTDPLLNMSAFFGPPIVSPPADRLVNDGDVLTLAAMEFEVRLIPGHSPGHVVYLVRGEQPGIVLGGDVLFRGSVGRTDFPGGSFATLRAGIEAKLWPLAQETVVYPGHGPVTTIGHERMTNPFLTS